MVIEETYFQGEVRKCAEATGQETLFTMLKLDRLCAHGSPAARDPSAGEQGAWAAERVQRELCRYGAAEHCAEKLMRALLLQVFYSVRSERQLLGHLR